MNDTLIKILKENYIRYGSKKVALRRKSRGIWQSYTWKDYYEKVKYFALGLLSLGFIEEQGVSVIGDNDPEYYWAWLATQAIGGIVTGVHPDTLSREVKYYIGHSGSSFVVAQDQEQVDKVIEVKDELPHVIKVIYWDKKGLWFYTEAYLMHFDDVIETGRKYEECHPQIFEDIIDKIRPDQTAALLYTSGTTGALPKASLVTQQSFLRGTELLLSVDSWPKGSRFVSVAPLSWGFDLVFAMMPGILLGAEVCFPESPDTVRMDTREIGPTVLAYGARQWEQISSDIRVGMSDVKGLKKIIYRLALFTASKLNSNNLETKSFGLFFKLLRVITRLIAFTGLLDKQGLSKAKYCYTAGAAISPAFLDFFQTLGMPLKQLYGVTEVGSVISVHRTDDINTETVGQLLPDTEARISDQGEILLRTSRVFLGYYRNPEATDEAMFRGWFLTGDGGYIDARGHLVFLGRVSEFRELSGGHRFPPEHIETKLRYSPYIKDAVAVCGPYGEYVSVLININYGNCGDWAEKNKISYTTFIDLSQKREIHEVIRQQIHVLNKTIPENARMRRFVCLPKELDADEGELTRTRKLRRGFVEQRYGDLIKAVYSDDKEFIAELPVIYLDGSEGLLKTSVTICEVCEVNKRGEP